ncbi:hypothetical protein ACX80W_05270 [Arthrobacter sp. TMN-37]
MIALRHGSELVQRGRFDLEQADSPVLYAFTRMLDGAALRVLGNVSGDPLGLPPGLGGGTLLLGNYDGGTGPDGGRSRTCSARGRCVSSGSPEAVPGYRSWVRVEE